MDDLELYKQVKELQQVVADIRVDNAKNEGRYVTYDELEKFQDKVNERFGFISRSFVGAIAMIIIYLIEQHLFK